MKRVLDAYLKSKRIAAFLGRKRVETFITVEVINFLGVNGCYYSLLVGYNQTEFLTASSGNQKYLGERKNALDLFDQLDNNLRIFNSREDWVDGKYDEVDIDKLSLQVQGLFEKRFSKSVGKGYGGFYCVAIKYSFEFCASLAVIYSFNDCPQKSLVLPLGNKSLVQCPIESSEAIRDFKQFIEIIDVAPLVEVVDPAAISKRLESFT